jgi:hypothetical protein
MGLRDSPRLARLARLARSVTHRPQLRFLLRSSLLLIGILALWWFGLRTPLLFGLQILEEAATPAAISVNDSGDWDFRIPVNDIHPEASGLVRVNHIEFTMPRADVTLFTFSLPFFWAIMLSPPFNRSQIHGLIWGSLAMIAIEVLLLFAAVEINTQGMIAHWHPQGDAWAKWWRQFASYMVTGVIPFFAPVFLAIAFSRELRTGILQFAAPRRTSQPARRRAAGKA